MVGMLRALALAGTLTACTTASSSDIIPVPAGQLTEVNFLTTFNARTCRYGRLPDPAIEQPAHGTVTVRRATKAFDASDFIGP